MKSNKLKIYAQARKFSLPECTLVFKVNVLSVPGVSKFSVMYEDPLILIEYHTYIFCQAKYALLDPPTKYLMCAEPHQNRENRDD